MPRPKRGKVAPSAPAQLPESLMRAIRADAASKREATGSVIRRPSVRQAPKAIFQDVSMSGALGVRNTSPSRANVPSANKDTRADGNAETADSEEREIVPSSIEPPKVQSVESPSSIAVPSTAQRPIPGKTATFGGNRHTQATPRCDSSVLGNFKLRRRQPSLLGIGRQDDSLTLTNLGGGDSDPFYSELEDFDPGITTPLIRTKAIPQKESNSSAHKITSSIAPTSNPRKRRREPGHDPAEILIPRSPQLTAEEASRLFGSSPVPFSELGEDTDLPLPKTGGPATLRSSGTSTPEVWSDTMAPPQSSPSETTSEPKEHHTSPKPKSSRRKPLPSPASSKKSIPRTRAQSSRALKPISTAQLQNLLPLRRDKNQSRKDDSFSIADPDPNNSDEASFAPTKQTRAPSKKQPKTPNKTASSKSKPKPKPTLRDKTNTKKPIPRSTTNKPTSTIKPTSRRTYTKSSHIVANGQENPRDTSTQSPSTEENTSDTEPQSIPNKNTTHPDPTPKSNHDELEAILQKFAEVDEWEMEFEEADESSGSGDVLLLGA